MCGIIGLFGKRGKAVPRERALRMAGMLRHRGPDWSGIYADDSCVLAHERLSIVDLEHGAQPLSDAERGTLLVANAEIYGHKELRGILKKEHRWQTESDCEVLLYLYDEYGPGFLDKVDGIFAFCLYEPASKEFLIARDHMGIVPLYIGWDREGIVHVASEMKALAPFCERFREFPPGHYYLGSAGRFVRWYSPEWMRSVPSAPGSCAGIREALEGSVRRQLMSDVPCGVLISGGLDSSIIASIVAKASGGGRVHSFSVGLKDSPDLRFARKVAEHVGTSHHEITYTAQEGIDALRDVIHHLETYDVTTVRASVPMYLMARKIRSHGIKVVLSGEGSDEVFGGYLYFHMAPSAREFHEETVRKLQKLSRFDCLRANKAMAAWGVEIRVPFLGKDFLDHSMSINPADKMCGGGKMEKCILRKAFEGSLPEDVLWRQKEQFSDGVGYGWIDSLKEHAEAEITDVMMAEAGKRFPLNKPVTKEAYLYRMIFDGLFPGDEAALTVEYGPSIACSTATAYEWSRKYGGPADPSGRSVAIHQSAAGREAHPYMVNKSG